MASGYHSPAVRFLVAMLSASDLLLFAKDLFVAAKVAVPPPGAQEMTTLGHCGRCAADHMDDGAERHHTEEC